jgi:uncharacterized caspase-like protein
MFVAVVILLCLSGAARAAQDTQFGRYHALVIGNNEYQYLENLNTAVNDASVVADILRRDYGFEVKLLLNANRYETVTALNDLRARLTPGDNLLIYYAGHGVLDPITDTGYWLPVDADISNDANWISNSTITNHVAAIRAKHVLVIADSCYSGTLMRGTAAKLQIGAERHAWLERMAEKRSRTVLASGGLEPVEDAGGQGHSVFTRQLIEALRDNRQVLDTQSLYDDIKQKVVLNADQTPHYDNIHKAGHDGGDFLFVPANLNRSVTVDAPTPSDEISRSPGAGSAADIMLWDAAEKLGTAKSFEDYLERFSEGLFVGQAKLRLETLEQIQ